jgi:small neutral amino acid transporter SnatA (MarC family)
VQLARSFAFHLLALFAAHLVDGVRFRISTKASRSAGGVVSFWHAWVLVNNHFHLLVEPKASELADASNGA